MYGPFILSLSLSLSPSLPPLSPCPSFLSTAQLLKEAQSYSQVTPMQVSYLFNLCSMEEKSAGSVTLRDFERLLPRPSSLSLTTPSPSIGTGTAEVCVYNGIPIDECKDFSVVMKLSNVLLVDKLITRNLSCKDKFNLCTKRTFHH